MTATADSRELVRIAAAAAADTGGEDLVALDVSQPLPFVDAFLLVTGRSERNVVAIADEVEDRLRDAGPAPCDAKAALRDAGRSLTSATSSFTCSTPKSAPTTRSNGCGRTARSSRSKRRSPADGETRPDARIFDQRPR